MVQVVNDPPVRVCDLIGGDCGSDTGDAEAPSGARYGPLRPCPRCGEPGGLIRCQACHGPYQARLWP